VGRKALFAKQSFWEALLELAGGRMSYSDYSHADRADVFALRLESNDWERLQKVLPMLKPRSAAQRVEWLRPEKVEWLVRR
jgi:hypothetical protein